MKTAVRARERLDEIRASGGLFASFGADAILEVLPYEQVRDLLVEGATKKQWEDGQPPYTCEGVVGRMREYMPFAWEKALGHRGISTNRSVLRFREWLAILGNDELVEEIDRGHLYPMYGAPILARICDVYGLSRPTGDAALKMANGEPCEPGCMEGCNS